MEISARVLRDVEFNSSLRGYNTDEVDEFLEQVAAGVDRLHEEVKAAVERAETAERAARERASLEDDESIRRTLVLAQRTADLAIREAQEEAAQILDRARAEAETLLGDARDSALRVTSEAERRLQDEVARLGEKRDELRKEADTLVSLLNTERERLTETLGAALRYVERSLTPSAELFSLPPLAPASNNGGDAVPADADTETRPVSVAPAPADASVPADASAPAATEDAEGEAASTNAAAAAPEDAPSPSGPETEAAVTEMPATAGGDEKKPEVDDLEAAIAEDAAAAAPAYVRRFEPEQYDWDSVIRGSEPLFPERDRPERTNLTTLRPVEEPSHETATMRMRPGPADFPA